MPPAADLPGLLEAFFTKRLIAQRQVSPHTLAAYRDTFRLLLAFAAHHYQRAPAQLNLRDLDADLIGAFLLDLEKTRGNTVHTRNLRRASLRAFFQYAALERPDQAAQIQRVLAIPAKRTTRPLIEFLTRAEADAVLAVVDRKTWRGQRDYALLLLLLQTGLRLAEATGLRPQDLSLGASPCARCLGKGRKLRDTPLLRPTARVLQTWCQHGLSPTAAYVFPNAQGGRLSHDAVQRLVAKYGRLAQAHCPALRQQRLTPHRLRHTAAMAMLHAGVDRALIALWLGHESVETTQIYLHANLALKQQILKRTQPPNAQQRRFQPTDPLLRFLRHL
ncbi:MAG: integrase [Verrucomicrobia bacterium]|nr:integrase [Verrucomicrobiota bacterium]